MSQTDADWVLKDADINVALGAEARAAREAVGLTRPQLVAHLPFKITVPTLLNWELGHRQISYARLAELARALHRTAPDLLRSAIGRVESLQSQLVELDPSLLAADTDPRFETLRVWAVNKHAATADKHADESPRVRVHHTVVREWAVLVGVPLPHLVKYLETAAAANQVHVDH